MDVFVLQGEFVERLFRGGSDLVVMAAIGFDWCRHRCGCGLKVFVVKISAHLQRKGFEGEEWGRLERKTQQTHWCFCGLEQKQKTVKESTILSINTQKG
jgi:hypothetical protein